MKYINTYEYFYTPIGTLKYKRGDYVILKQDEPDIYNHYIIVNADETSVYPYKAFSVKKDRDVYLKEHSILRKLTDEDFERMEIEKDAEKYNL